MPEALGVLTAWGFAYKLLFAWAKDKIGLRFYARGQHELLLLLRVHVASGVAEGGEGSELAFGSR